jgi:hypothetical protein
VGRGSIRNDWNVHNAACRHDHRRLDDVHGPWSVAGDELQLPADRIPWNAERQCGLRRPLEHCLGFDNWRATATTAATATATAPTAGRSALARERANRHDGYHRS